MMVDRETIISIDAVQATCSELHAPCTWFCLFILAAYASKIMIMRWQTKQLSSAPV